MQDALIWYAFHAQSEDLALMRERCPAGVAERAFARYVFALGVRFLLSLPRLQVAQQALVELPALPAPPAPRSPRARRPRRATRQ